MLPTQISPPVPNDHMMTDAALTYEIIRAFKTESILRALDYSEIDVQVESGVAYLYGYLANKVNQKRIENLTRAVPGIKEITSNLILDDGLTLEVAASLASLEHMYDCKLFTGSSHGVVSLNGVVHNEDVKLLAEQCAASNSKVRGVINDIRLSGTGFGVQGEPFLQPVIGEIIFFLDGVSGVVKQVIVNPNNRRVLQMIVEGKFPVERQHQNMHLKYEPDTLNKIVVIPVTLIRHLTKNSGFLNIKSTETTQYEDFNPLYFVTPEADWVPPYPYFQQDTIFAIKAEAIENQKMIDPDIKQLNISAQPTTPLKAEKSIDIPSTWEDDGGQTVQAEELVNSI